MTETLTRLCGHSLGQLIEAFAQIGTTLISNSTTTGHLIRLPKVPNEFEHLDTFLDYHHMVILREWPSSTTRTLKKAKKEYPGAARQLLLFLPEVLPVIPTRRAER